MIFSQLLSNTALGVVGLTVAIYVVGVTFLGKASKLQREHQEQARQDSKSKFNAEKEKLTKEISESSREQLPALRDKLKRVEQGLSIADKEIQAIERKYDAINLRHSVIWPSVLSGLAILLQYLREQSFIVIGWSNLPLIIDLISLALFVLALRYVYNALRSLQFISAESEGYESQQMQDAVYQALVKVDADKRPNLQLKILNEPPLLLTRGQNFELKYQVNLSKGGAEEAKNVEVWMLFSEGVIPEQGKGQRKPFKQGNDSAFPNAWTVICDHSLVKWGTITSGSVKLKAEQKGDYVMKYRINCDGVADSISNHQPRTIRVIAE